MDRNAPGAIVAAIVVSVVGVFALMTMPVIIGIYSQTLGFDSNQGNLIMIAEVAGGALASLLAVTWITRISWRKAIAFALIVIVAGNVLTVLQPDATTIAIIRFAVGLLGQGTAFVIGISIIGNTSDPDRNFGFVITAQVLFGVIALATIPSLVNAMGGIVGMYGPLAALAGLGLLLLKNIPQGGAQADAAADATTQGSAALPLTTLVAMLLWCCGLGAMWGFVGVIASSETGGLSLEAVGFAVSISSAVAIAGSLGAATLAAKGVNRFLPVTIALLVQMVVAWLIQGELSFVELVIKASIFQIFWNMTGPFFMGAIAASDTGGKISVLIPAAQTSGFFIGPTVVGLFLGDYGLTAANVVTIVFCLVSLLMFIPLSARLKAAGY